VCVCVCVCHCIVAPPLRVTAIQLQLQLQLTASVHTEVKIVSLLALSVTNNVRRFCGFGAVYVSLLTYLLSLLRHGETANTMLRRRGYITYIPSLCTHKTTVWSTELYV